MRGLWVFGYVLLELHKECEEISLTKNPKAQNPKTKEDKGSLWASTPTSGRRTSAA